MIGPKSISEALHIAPTISTDMIDAIELWGDMYQEKSPWLHDGTIADPVTVKSMGLPAFISSEKARTALLEMNCEITAVKREVEKPNPNYAPPQYNELGQLVMGGQPKTIKTDEDIGDTTRAKYIDKQFDKVRAEIRKQLEYGCAKGGLVIKPYVVQRDTTVPESNADVIGLVDKTPIATQIEFDYVQADGFYPISFDASGRITEAAFVQRKIEKDTTYSRLEYHRLNQSENSVTIQNRCFKSTNTTNMQNQSIGEDIGTECSLSEVPEWAGLEKETTIAGVDRLLFAYFKMPEANTIDTTSPLGVSCFSRAVKLIEEADKQYSRILWEFEGGELAVDVDRDAMSERAIHNNDGSYSMVATRPVMQERLFRKIDLNKEDTYNIFNPAFRDVSLINGLNNILMRIEDVTGLSRGTIADVSQEARTATELRILKQRSYASNLDVQRALEKALRDVIYIMDVYCDLYQIVPAGDFDVSFEWDDSILVDVEQELGKRITLMQNGLASKLETRMWYFNETEAQAQLALDRIKEENQEQIEQNMQFQVGLSKNQPDTSGANPEDEEGNEPPTNANPGEPDDKEPKDPTSKEFRKLSGPSK